MDSRGWIGFDLDGTLAHYDSADFGSGGHIGKPIEPMVELAKTYLANGYEVRIVTARAAAPYWIAPINEWCKKHLGQVLTITDRKDFAMLLLYDDRAVAVETNTGKTAGFRL